MEARKRFRGQLSGEGVQGALGGSAPKRAPPKKKPEPEIPPVEFIVEKPKKKRAMVPPEVAPDRNRQKLPKKTVPDYGHAHQLGARPAYMEQRKAEIAAKNKPPEESNCPPGMKELTQQEKAEALDSLRYQKEEIEATLAKAPLRIESPQLLRQKKDLEQQLSEIEHSIQQLQKKHVFVPE